MAVPLGGKLVSYLVMSFVLMLPELSVLMANIGSSN
jgi:hypothetical protein